MYAHDQKDQYLITSETIFKVSQKRSNAFKLDTDGKKLTLQATEDFEKWAIVSVLHVDAEVIWDVGTDLFVLLQTVASPSCA